MAGDLQITRYRVQDCILRLTEKNLSVPVARFDLDFALNAIPEAQIIPAFGRVIFGAGKGASLTDIQEKDAVDLIIKVNGIQTLLLSGYISFIRTDDTASMFARRQALRLTVTHRAVKLAGAPSMSFVYAGHTGQSLDELGLFKTRVNPFLSGGGAHTAQSVHAPTSAVAWLLSRGELVGYFPGHVLKDITMGLFNEYNDPQMSQEDLDTLIRTYDPANLLNIVPEISTFLSYIVEKYASAWKSQNAWQALVSTAQEMMLQIIPFNTGFYIANPYSLNRNPARVIKAKEYIQVGQGLTADLGEPKDGIVLTSPASMGGGLNDVFSFPSIITGNETLVNKYYHYRSFPAWLQPSMAYINGALSKGNHFSPPPNPTFPQEAETLEEYYKLVGGNLARAMYGQIKQAQRRSTMVFPFRQPWDLMPGTSLQFDDSALGISFIGDTTYGMVVATRISCDTLAESPSLKATVDVVALRNTKDNTDDKLTFDGHPVFQEQWVGIDINGDFLKDPPDVKGPGDLPAEWFAGIEGAKKKEDELKDKDKNKNLPTGLSGDINARDLPDGGEDAGAISGTEEEQTRIDDLQDPPPEDRSTSPGPRECENLR